MQYKRQDVKTRKWIGIFENTRFVNEYAQCAICHIAKKTKVTGISSRHLRRGHSPRIPVTPTLRSSSVRIVPKSGIRAQGVRGKSGKTGSGEWGTGNGERRGGVIIAMLADNG